MKSGAGSGTVAPVIGGTEGSDMRVLVGDVGGTNTRLALYEGDTRLAVTKVRNTEHGGLAGIARAFVAAQAERHGRPQAACIGIAGPVRRGSVHMTNLGWRTDEAEMSAAVGAPCRLINDFHAQALAMPRLRPGEYESIGGDEAGVEDDAPRVVIGPGTGLGEAFLVPGPRGWIAVPGEGAHTRFAPRDERELVLLRHLMALFPGHVSVERVVSGPGLVTVYDHLRGDGPRLPAMADEEPAAVISREALAGGDPHCCAAVDVFVGVLGDEAASLALKVNAGVVYLTGGIPPRIAPLIRSGIRRSFDTKGRYSTWTKTVPIRLVLHPDPGLLGARVMAESLGEAPSTAAGA